MPDVVEIPRSSRAIITPDAGTQVRAAGGTVVAGAGVVVFASGLAEVVARTRSRVYSTSSGRITIEGEADVYLSGEANAVVVAGSPRVFVSARSRLDVLDGAEPRVRITHGHHPSVRERHSLLPAILNSYGVIASGRAPLEVFAAITPAQADTLPSRDGLSRIASCHEFALDLTSALAHAETGCTRVIACSTWTHLLTPGSRFGLVRTSALTLRRVVATELG